MRLFLNQKGSSLAGALVATSIVTTAFLAFQENFLKSTKDLSLLKTKTARRSIITNLQMSALSVTALKKTKEKNDEVKKCIDAEGTCDGKTWHPISWINSKGKIIAGFSELSTPTSTKSVQYDKQGVRCNSLSTSFSFTAGNVHKNGALVGGHYYRGFFRDGHVNSYKKGNSSYSDAPSDFLGMFYHNSKLWFYAKNDLMNEIKKIEIKKSGVGSGKIHNFNSVSPSGSANKRWKGISVSDADSLNVGENYTATLIFTEDDSWNKGGKCNFATRANIRFYCPNNTETCSQADSAEVRFRVVHSLSVDNAGLGNHRYTFYVTIPRVTPEVIETIEATNTSSSQTRHTSSTRYNYGGGGDGNPGSGGGDGDGDGGGDGMSSGPGNPDGHPGVPF